MMRMVMISARSPSPESHRGRNLETSGFYHGTSVEKCFSDGRLRAGQLVAEDILFHVFITNVPARSAFNFIRFWARLMFHAWRALQ